MDRREFTLIRNILGKTQEELARLLGLSTKAVQSIEQGWRNISIQTERHLLFILALRMPSKKKSQPCWLALKCPPENRKACPAWEFKAGHLCWFVNGTICQGKVQQSWKTKMTICRQCEVFQLRDYLASRQ